MVERNLPSRGCQGDLRHMQITYMGVGCNSISAGIRVVYTFGALDPDNDDKEMTKILTCSDLGKRHKTEVLERESTYAY